MSSQAFDVYHLLAVLTVLTVFAAAATLIRGSGELRQGFGLGWLSLLMGVSLLVVLALENEGETRRDAFGFRARLPTLLAIALHLLALLASAIGLERVIRGRDARGAGQVELPDEARLELKPALNAARPLTGAYLLRQELLPVLRVIRGFSILVFVFAVLHFAADAPYLKGVMTLFFSAIGLGIGGLAISLWAAARTWRRTDTRYADRLPRTLLTLVLSVASCTIAALVVMLLLLGMVKVFS